MGTSIFGRQFLELDLISSMQHNENGPSVRRDKISLGWIKAAAPWMKLNVVGASTGTQRLRGAACVIRDEEGRWRRGAARNLGSCSVEPAELWAVLLGLELAWAAGYKKIIIETDSKLALSLIKKDYGPLGHQISSSGNVWS